MLSNHTESNNVLKILIYILLAVVGILGILIILIFFKIARSPSLKSNFSNVNTSVSPIETDQLDQMAIISSIPTVPTKIENSQSMINTDAQNFYSDWPIPFSFRYPQGMMVDLFKNDLTLKAITPLNKHDYMMIMTISNPSTQGIETSDIKNKDEYVLNNYTSTQCSGLSRYEHLIINGLPVVAGFYQNHEDFFCEDLGLSTPDFSLPVAYLVGLDNTNNNYPLIWIFTNNKTNIDRALSLINSIKLLYPEGSSIWLDKVTSLATDTETDIKVKSITNNLYQNNDLNNPISLNEQAEQLPGLIYSLLSQENLAINSLYSENVEYSNNIHVNEYISTATASPWRWEIKWEKPQPLIIKTNTAGSSQQVIYPQEVTVWLDGDVLKMVIMTSYSDSPIYYSYKSIFNPNNNSLHLKLYQLTDSNLTQSSN